MAFDFSSNAHDTVPLQSYSCDILAQAHTNKPVANGASTIGVKGHATVIHNGGRCTEVRRDGITAPMGTLLVTIITREPGHEEPGVERGMTDQQLIRVSIVDCSHTVPQSIGISVLPIVICGRYGLPGFKGPGLGLSREVGLVSSLVINEDDFCEL